MGKYNNDGNKWNCRTHTMDSLQDDINLLTIYDFEKKLKEKFGRWAGYGLVFCFGTSLISRIIQAKTRQYDGEVVPSHVLMIAGNMVLESTTDVCTVNHKRIPGGVRCWRLEDWAANEKNRLTKYYYYETTRIDIDTATSLLHLPYGKDTIVDFLIKDKSEGDRTHGLICSQYANKCTQLSKQKCPSPADLFRIVKDLEKE